MPLTLRRYVSILALGGSTWGCGSDSGADSVDSAALAAAREPAAARPPLTTPAAESARLGPPRDSARAKAVSAGVGLWDLAALEKRLDLQGMAPRKQAAPVRHPFLSVEGTTYLVGNAELQVFIYDDAAAVERDIAKLDTIAVAPPGQTVQWRDKPTLIRNNNLAAILLGRNELQIERMQRALMAGLAPPP